MCIRDSQTTARGIASDRAPRYRRRSCRRSHGATAAVRQNPPPTTILGATKQLHPLSAKSADEKEHRRQQTTSPRNSLGSSALVPPAILSPVPRSDRRDSTK